MFKQEDFLTIKELTAKVNLTQGRIYNRIKEKTFPKGTKLGYSRVWTNQEVEQWIKENQDKKFAIIKK